MILVFGFGQGTKIIPNLSPQQEYITVEQIEITRQDPLQPQVPTPAQALITDADIFKIVPDDTKIEVNPVFVDFDPWTDFNSNPTSSVEIWGDPEIDELFLSAEFMPKFQGGDINTTFRRWVNERVVYPQMAASMGVTGTVTLQFVIERDGSLTNIEVFNSSGDSMLDNEAVRVLRQSPLWEPGKQGDRPVRVAHTMPIVFQLQR
ncbi:MAG: energy transducer TonB [Rikenellaceae bacterium]|nr:energy transducer TonB [Rikenellaceae bacterium]